MNNPPGPPLYELPTHSLLPSPRKARFVRLRSWLRSRTGRIIVPLVALVLGIVIGILSLLFYGLSGEGQVLLVPTSGKGDIVVEADKAFLTHLIEMNLRNAGMPGNINNVEVDLARGDRMTINGNDGFSLLGIGVTKHFSIIVQPYVGRCVLQIHVVHADVSSIPVTGFAQAFESHINQQLQQKPGGLPQGFQYCASSVSTEAAGMFVTYSATPT